MTTSILRTVLTLGLGAFSSVSLFAQGPINVTIPFDFTVNAKSFAAGEYRVTPQAPQVLAIQRADGSASMVTLTHNVEGTKAAGEAGLTFHRYGNRYFLSQIWTGGSLGYELRTSSLEREVAKSASGQPVVVASGRR